MSTPVSCPFTGWEADRCDLRDPHISAHHLAWHATNMLIPMAEALTGAPPRPTALTVVSSRALAYAVAGNARMVAAEMGLLDDGQLKLLAEAAQRLAEAAAAALAGRHGR